MRQRVLYCCTPGSNKGIALLVLLLLIVVAFGTTLVSSLSKVNFESQRQQKTLNALVQAKQALIAWSVMQGDLGTSSNPRPGTLPCPDTNFFGSSNSGYASGSCSSSGTTSIDRLPWKTLGIEMLRDASGEPLWYALSDSFRNPNLNDDAINSNSIGTLLLYAADGTTLMTPSGDELAAVIFAPNAPTPGQNRSTAPDDPANYLEAFGGLNNTSATGPYIAGPAKNVQGNIVANDAAIGITAKELIAALEKRALREAQNALSTFATVHSGKYPNPASLTCNGNITNVNAAVVACASDSTTCLGRLPEDALSPYVASWFLKNGWGRTLLYAVNKGNAVDPTGANCATTLSVDGANKQYVLVAPGTARSGQNRPSNALSDYLDDTPNVLAWAGPQSFSAPNAGSNDQLRSQP